MKTCRECEKEIFSRPWSFGRTVWLDAEELKEEQATIIRAYQRDCNHEPKEICNRIMESGRNCETAVKPENIRTGNYSCGRHMHLWIEDQETKKRQEEREYKNKMEQATAQWELATYQAAYDKLVELGFSPILGGRPEILTYGYQRNRVSNKEVQLDLLVLLEMATDDEEATETPEAQDENPDPLREVG